MAQELVLHNGAVYNDAAAGNDVVVDSIVFDEAESGGGASTTQLLSQFGTYGMDTMSGGFK